MVDLIWRPAAHLEVMMGTKKKGKGKGSAWEDSLWRSSGSICTSTLVFWQRTGHLLSKPYIITRTSSRTSSSSPSTSALFHSTSSPAEPLASFSTRIRRSFCAQLRALSPSTPTKRLPNLLALSASGTTATPATSATWTSTASSESTATLPTTHNHRIYPVAKFRSARQTATSRSPSFQQCQQFRQQPETNRSFIYVQNSAVSLRLKAYIP